MEAKAATTAPRRSSCMRPEPMTPLIGRVPLPGGGKLLHLDVVDGGAAAVGRVRLVGEAERHLTAPGHGQRPAQPPRVGGGVARRAETLADRWQTVPEHGHP